MVHFPQNRFVKLETTAQIVLQLGDGGSPAGQTLVNETACKLYGFAVEISDTGRYFRDQHGFRDDGMREVMGATELENQVDGVLDESRHHEYQAFSCNKCDFQLSRGN
ncbi:hypothetical protein N7520_008710 [Penicillium odoratum]|uniref:uncharacterized protein n=1 Tax=Penicillium odoratum TaxID=1167516 RepID=UPI0025470D25|nr:uncharacterized protein N7520_008710 [Penicillium odoratum]KAJ5751793.1 hypothetical protein N7520_008710 [Penicillium odoratum]